MKIIIVGITSLGILILLYILFLALTYIDRSVAQGEAYGFKIGDSKEVTYKNARSLFKNKKVYILYPLEKNGFGPHTVFTFTPEEFDLIKNNEIWTLYFTEKYSDFLRLAFKDDCLIKIYRHRKKFELP